MTPEKFVKMTKEFILHLEAILSVYDSSMRKCERIEQTLNQFKEDIKSELNGEG